MLEYIHNGTVSDELTQVIQEHVEDANSDGPWVEEAREMLTYEQVLEAEKRVARSSVEFSDGSLRVCAG